MKYLLAPAELDLLRRALTSRALLAFDFDGTLAPIVTERDAAQMRQATANLFRQVSERYVCAVISGRAQKDVAPRLAGARVKHVVGNHGSEPHDQAADFAAEVAQASACLSSALRACPGVDIEDKRYSLAIHYRAAPERQHARALIQAAVVSCAPRLRRVPGKLVLNLIPARAPDKGQALQRLLAVEQADVALYVGDDVTDEDVFRLDKPARIITTRIGETKASAAQFYLRNQLEVDSLLAALANVT
ncbi:MAG TPA: trehalose-phosphatase [Polyangiales bacterium]|nr:trehalose-phosphatase [Polyangiales bacterium]